MSFSDTQIHVRKKHLRSSPARFTGIFKHFKGIIALLRETAGLTHISYIYLVFSHIFLLITADYQLINLTRAKLCYGHLAVPYANPRRRMPILRSMLTLCHVVTSPACMLGASHIFLLSTPTTN